MQADGRFALRRVLLAVLLFAFVAATPTAAIAADGIRSLEVESYRNDHGVSAQVAARNLATQQRGTGIVQRLEAVQDDRYAGVWFDNEAGEFVVPVLGERSRESARVTLATAGLTGSYRTVFAEHSWGDLKAAHTRLDAELLQLIRENKVRTFLDPHTNAVVVEQAAGASGGEAVAIKRLADGQGVRVEVRPRKAVRFSVKPAWCGEPYCSKPLRGGVTIEGKSTACTAGFKATGSGNPYILTAGHCADGESIWYSKNPDNYYEKEAIGNTAGYTFPGGDWAKIDAGGSYWDQSPWPSLVADWHGDDELHISYEDISYVGRQVCHSGSFTGSWGSVCGTVTAVDYTYNSDPAGPIYHMTKFGPVCVASGDSGGPVFDGNTALGLVSHADAGEGGFCGANIYYPEITEATDDLGVTVAPDAPKLVATTEGTGSIEADENDGMATLHGTVNPRGLETSYTFEWGETEEYGSSTTLEELGATSDENHPVDAIIEGLKGGTEYHYRLRAENAKEVAFGEDKTFETPDWRPEVEVEEPSYPTGGSATLHGEVNPNAFATTYQFEWGSTSEYGNVVPVSPKEVGSGTEDVEVGETISGLEGKKTYHYRLVATNEEGTVATGDETFETPDWAPVAATGEADEVGATDAALNATVDPSGFATTYRFEWGPTSEYGNSVPVPDGEAGLGDEPVEVEETVEKLHPESTYHFRVVASSAEGTAYGEDETFTTLARGPKVATEAYPASLSAATEQEIGAEEEFFELGSPRVECEEVSFTAQLNGPAGTLPIDAQYKDASSEGNCRTSEALVTYIDTGSCGYELDVLNAGPPYKGSLGVACAEEGDAIEITIRNLFNTKDICHISIAPQQGLEAIDLQNEGEGSERKVGAQIVIEGLTYTLKSESSLCGQEAETEETHEDGSYVADLSFAGTAEEQVGAFVDPEPTLGLYMAGEEAEVEQPHLATEAHPASLSAATEQEIGAEEEFFELGSPRVECEEASFTAQLNGPAGTLPIDAQYKDAEAEGNCRVGGILVTHIDTGSCGYELDVLNAGPPYKGSLGVACAEEGDAIEITIRNLFNTKDICHISIAPQQGLEAIDLQNEGEGSERKVGAEIAVEGLTYTLKSESSLCGQEAETEETHEDGVYVADLSFAGTGPAEEQVGAFVEGEESEEEQPRVEAEAYPAVIEGDQDAEDPHTLTVNELSIACELSHLDAEIAAPALLLPIEAHYEECRTGEILKTHVDTNSCGYVLHPKNAGPPYVGELILVCEQQGDAIEIEIRNLFDTGTQCEVSIGPQQLGPVGLQPVGEGSERALDLDLELEGFAFTLTSYGSLCGQEAETEETYEDGAFSGGTTLQAWPE